MVDKALSIISREFKKLRETKISERELKKAKESIKGNIILSLGKHNQQNDQNGTVRVLL